LYLDFGAYQVFMVIAYRDESCDDFSRRFHYAA